MLKKLLLALGIGVAAGASPSMAADFHQPYADASRNLLYNLLFCDDPSLLRQPLRMGVCATSTNRRP
jgi:hypothetical protein